MVYPQEKVHVMTDREFYMSGDTVWMHSLLVDDIDTTVVHGRSRYLYAELRDYKDSLVNRVKLRATLTQVPPRQSSDQTPVRNMTLFSGYLPLPPTIVSGDYTLVAYTAYMAGTSEIGWFKKRLHVLTPQDVAYGFVPRVVMEPGFIPERCDTVIDVSSSAGDLSLLSLAGLKERPKLIMASLNDNKYVPSAHTEPDIVETMSSIPDIYSPEFIEALGGVIVPRNAIEVGQVVSGTVYGNWKTRTPQSGVKVDIFTAAETGFFDTQTTDSLGHFEFNGFEFADGAQMTLMARKGRGQRVMDNIKVDPLCLPDKVRHKHTYKSYYSNRRQYERDTVLADDAMLSADALMRLAQNSDVFQSYLLKEIDVKGERKIKVKGAYSNLAYKSLDGEQLEEQGVMDLAGAIQRLPGVMITNGAILWRNMYVALFIDQLPELGLPAFEDDDYGFRYDSSLSMPITSIARVDFLNESNASMMGGSNLRGQPVIAVTLRMGASLSDMNVSHCLIHRPLGHQPLAHFVPNASSGMFFAELGLFLDSAESKWQQALRHLASGSEHTLIIEGIDSSGNPFARHITIKM